ncbi:carboxypeptidase-like regulatory domain-containing protein [Pontixanthobacter gangjinensis]|uniref:TonB-dependent receptor n=1 Tax=Christiangramia aestuarii TaxID=1028746 RepID=A0A7K1LR38_9FLAO|nr:TonB-dependent receptor plug domain-containing protein [Christiangramia aestuarii]MUP43228.1 TonB-dependent receptor [Christiangramia aestuarii]
MKISIFWVLLLSLFSLDIHAQQPALEGRLVDAITNVPLPQVKIAIEGSFLETFTAPDGTFSLGLENIAQKEVLLNISRTGYINRRLPVKLNAEGKKLGEISLQPDEFYEGNNQVTISLTDAEVLGEEGSFDNISGILQSTRDVYLNTAAFDFSQTFFRVRGLGAEYGKLLINGMEMNKFYDGRPQWSNWGGLNDVQRNQVFTNGIGAGEYAFGGLGGTTNILMRASKYQKSARLSLAGANRTYTGRAMATYSSGIQENGWYYAFSIGKRYAAEGYIDGTVFDANSFFMSVEKEFGESHAINLAAIYTPVARGRSAPLTKEVLQLKGSRYNPYWGMQEGEIRNSRMREVREPVLMLNHFWDISEPLQLNTNISYQFGEVSNSRIDYGGTNPVNLGEQVAFVGGGQNPDPTYYQKLPGYYLRFAGSENFEAAYRAQIDLLENGQLDWEQLYRANQNNPENAVYVLAEDINQDKIFSANTILSWNINERLKLNSTLSFSKLDSHNFARIGDLFGGETYLDIDVFAEEGEANPLVSAVQANLLEPNRMVQEGDLYKYDYEIEASRAESFVQAQYYFRKLELSLSAKLGRVNYQRDGNYQNGIFPQNSLGKSEQAAFLEYGLKSAAVYKFSGRQNIEMNIGYFSKAPGYRNVFVNPRQNNQVVPDISEEIIQTLDLSYRFRSSKFNFRLTGFYTEVNNATEVSYYFANGISDQGMENSSAFVQELLSDIDKQYLGMELGSEYQVTTTLKLKAAAGIGQYIYSNNPQLRLSSASFERIQDYGRSYLKNYRLPGGPQQATMFGFEYRDPAYWWFGATMNFFSQAFIDVNPLSRTSNFQTDYDGQPLLDYDPEIARELLEQEQFQDYYLLNLVGGKSWRIKDKYLGIFMSVNNLLDKEYISGGFEQARNSNYRNLKEDRDRDIPVFGNKYWLGYGTSFFANLSLKF